MELYKKNNYQLKLSPTIPLYNLVNLRQLVFEVTTFCNLNCEYCCYGKLYETRTHHKKVNMPFLKAKLILDYLFDLWNRHKSDYDIRDTSIGFYGGEPLLNFDFIRSVILYVEEKNFKNRHFIYNITTNAMLLDKYMDFLVEKKFQILISLDGDKIADSYRVDHAGKNSFDTVFANIKKLQIKYPDFFEKYVSFNSVLTNRGDILEIKDFFRKEFNKDTMISEVNSNGIQKNKKEEFNIIYKSIEKELSTKSYHDISQKVDFVKFPKNKVSHLILKNLSGNSFRSYNALLPQKECKIFPTGTCFPFSKKMFINVNGEVFPCERISQKYSLGYISEDKVNIDFEEIARKYSNYYKKVHERCKGCYAKPICEQCMFYINNLETEPTCPNFLTKEQYDKLVHSHLSYLAENPQIYQKIMKEMY